MDNNSFMDKNFIVVRSGGSYFREGGILGGEIFLISNKEIKKALRREYEYEKNKKSRLSKQESSSSFLEGSRADLISTDTLKGRANFQIKSHSQIMIHLLKAGQALGIAALLAGILILSIFGGSFSFWIISVSLMFLGLLFGLLSVTYAVKFHKENAQVDKNNLKLGSFIPFIDHEKAIPVTQIVEEEVSEKIKWEDEEGNIYVSGNFIQATASNQEEGVYLSVGNTLFESPTKIIKGVLYEKDKENISFLK